MKRDLDLVRQLLFVIESSETAALNHVYGLSPGDQRVQYHLRLLVDAGLARGVGLTGEGSVCVRLTWDGHEMLELVRNESLWDRAKRLVQDKTGGNSLEAIRAVLRKWTELSVADEDRWPVRLPHQHVNGSHVNGTGTNGTGINGTGINGTGANGAYVNGRSHHVTSSRWPVSRKPIEEVVRGTAPAPRPASTPIPATAAPSNDTSFQFSVWTGHDAERKPLYML